MKLFIIALKSEEHQTMPQFALDALKCAQLYSGMDVVGLSDFGERNFQDATPYMERANAFRSAFRNACGKETRDLPATLRWFIIEEFVRAHSIQVPVFNIDWEVMVFGDIESHCRKLGVVNGDIGDTTDKALSDHNRTAPYWINNHSAVQFFTAMLEAHVKCRTPLLTGHKCGGDMNWWEHVRTAGGYTPVDISLEIDDCLFDLNIMLEKNIYHSNAEAKLLFWKDGKPYFKRQSDDGLVRAIAVHCFWTWKEKTSDILLKATSGYSD